MNYKRMSFRALMLALVTVLLAGFASCSKSDDDNKDNQGQSEVSTSAIINLYYTATEAELSICDMTIEYTDAAGATQTEALTSTKWSKQIKYSSLPANGTIVIKRALKANVELTEKSYKFSDNSLTWTVFTYNAQGTKTAGPISYGDTTAFAAGKDDVQKYVNGHSKYTITYTIDPKNGVSDKTTKN